MEMNKKDVTPIEIENLHGFGARLKRLRHENGMTMEQFGKRIGVSAPTIAAYETESRSPRLEVITAISQAYDCSVDFLLGLTDVRQVKQDIYDAHNFFMKENINWHGRPIDPNDLTAFRMLLEQIMDSKTGYEAPERKAQHEETKILETNSEFNTPDYFKYLEDDNKDS